LRCVFYVLFGGSIVDSLAYDKRQQLYKFITAKHKGAYAQLAELRTSPQNANIPSEHLQKISALMVKHIPIYGTYHFEDI